MVTAKEIEPLRGQSADTAQTEHLKRQFAALRTERNPFYLTLSEFEVIVRWKLEGQYGRAARFFVPLTDEIVRGVTRAAVEVSHPDWRYEATLKIGLLVAIPGVGAPIASAVLALTDPDRFGVIDFRGWRALFGEEKTGFTISEYVRYLDALRSLAAQLGWPVQEVDLAIWQLDKNRAVSV